ncbi:MAG TPA: flagellar biosynthetic protein FliR, partial [Armatimonadota bacterium]|nr:flagellar biosynthetic protein FliR [Armatimonadota bacterium]
MDLAFLGIGQLQMFLLILARTAGIFTLVPLFGAKQIPVMVRIAIALGITMVFVPFCQSTGTKPLAVDVMPMVALIVKETIVGLVIGFVTTLVFTAIQLAGDYIDLQSGFSFATMFDPVYGAQTAVAGRLHHLLAGLLFFVTNAHHILLSGLADSFRLLPVGQFSLDPAVAGGVVDLFAALFAVAVRIAAPVVAAVFLADVALAMISRAVPQMNILMSGLPLKLGVGIVGMLVALP